MGCMEHVLKEQRYYIQLEIQLLQPEDRQRLADYEKRVKEELDDYDDITINIPNAKGSSEAIVSQAGIVKPETMPLSFYGNLNRRVRRRSRFDILFHMLIVL